MSFALQNWGHDPPWKRRQKKVLPGRSNDQESTHTRHDNIACVMFQKASLTTPPHLFACLEFHPVLIFLFAFILDLGDDHNKIFFLGNVFVQPTLCLSQSRSPLASWYQVNPEKRSNMLEPYQEPTWNMSVAFAV